MQKIFIEYEKCLGCGLCELACSFEKEGLFNPTLSRISVTRLYLSGLYIPLVCQQCTKPLCAEVCPVNAISRNGQTGAMIFNVDRCLGCQMCRMACPISAPIWDEVRGVVSNCDLCDGEPKCVQACAVGALQYIDEAEANILREGPIAEKLAELTKIL